MRILYVTEVSGQGTGQHVLDLAAGARDREHDVHIIYSNVRIDRDFQNRLNSLRGVTLHHVPMRRSIHWRDVTATAAIRAYIAQQGPFDIVHGHSSKGGALARLAGLGSGAVCFYTPHCLRSCDPELSRAKRAFFRVIERTLSGFTDAWLLCSPEERAEAQAIGLPAQKLFLIPHGIRFGDAVPRAVARHRLGLCDQEICIGFVGRFVPQKAPARLLRAAALIGPRLPELRLVMVGGGDLEPSLHAKAQSLGIARQVIWTGVIPSAQVFGAMDMLVMPSRYEGLSYTVMEAMAQGIPVIVTDCGGMSTLVASERTGIIVPQSGPGIFEARLGEAIAQLAAAPARRQAMAREAKTRSESFTADRMIEQTLLVYQALRKPKWRARSKARAMSSMKAASWPSLADYARLVCRAGQNDDAERPVVSVVTITKNAGATLKRTIMSVHEQTETSVEHILVDGGSKDDTVDIVQSLLRPQDRWISEPDLGISDAFNKGIALARGAYIQILNADDWLSSNQLEIAATILTERPDADFVFGDCVAYDQGRPVFRYRSDEDYARQITRRMTINHPSMLVRADAYRRFGLYRLNLQSAMDYEWLLRVHRLGGVGIYDPRIVSHVGLGGTHLRFYKRTMREVRDTAVAFGRAPFSAFLEYWFHLGKNMMARPLQQRARPVYDRARSWINASFDPVVASRRREDR